MSLPLKIEEGVIQYFLSLRRYKLYSLTLLVNSFSFLPADCLQLSHGGTADGACCKFPFLYKGKEYRSCTTAGTDKLKKQFMWCSATTHYDRDKLWGLC